MTGRTAPAVPRPRTSPAAAAPGLSSGSRFAVVLPGTPGAVVQVVNETRVTMPRGVLAAVIASVCESLEVTADPAALTEWLTDRFADRMLVLDDELCGPEVWAQLAALADVDPTPTTDAGGTR